MLGSTFLDAMLFAGGRSVPLAMDLVLGYILTTNKPEPWLRAKQYCIHMHLYFVIVRGVDSKRIFEILLNSCIVQNHGLREGKKKSGKVRSSGDRLVNKLVSYCNSLLCFASLRNILYLEVTLNRLLFSDPLPQNNCLLNILSLTNKFVLFSGLL